MSTDKELVKMYVQGKCPEHLIESVYALRGQSIKRSLDPKVASNDYSSHEALELIVSKYGEDKLKEKITGQKVIELGPAHNPRAKFFLDLGAKEYVGIELFNSFISSCFIQNYSSKAKIVQKDALSYLLNQEDESAVIVSLGFLCDSLHSQNPHYISFLSKEIYRVTPKNQISIHSGATDVSKTLATAGFDVSDASIYGDPGTTQHFLGVFKK